jgi:hypothetical protein
MASCETDFVLASTPLLSILTLRYYLRGLPRYLLVPAYVLVRGEYVACACSPPELVQYAILSFSQGLETTLSV